MKAVLLGGDQADFSQLQRLLNAVGWELTRADPDAAALNLRGQRDTILLLDARTDVTSTASIVRGLRRNKIQCPIAVLAPPLSDGKVRSALASALRAGADDFFLRTVDPEELGLRLHAVLDRQRHSDFDSAVSVGDIEIGRASRTLSCNGQSVSLTEYEYRTFERLARRRDKP